MMDEFYTVDEAADLLKVSPNTIRNWRRQGLFPNSVVLNQVVRITREDIKNLSKKEAS